MSYYNIKKQIERAELPAAIPPYKGVKWPRDKQKFLDAGWRMVEFPNPPPAEMHVTGTSYTPKQGSDDTVIKAQTWETQEQFEHNKQNAKPQAVKNREKKLKDLLVKYEFTVPVKPGDMDGIISALKADIDASVALIPDPKTRIAIEQTADSLIMLAEFVILGPDVYSPLLGEGGQD